MRARLPDRCDHDAPGTQSGAAKERAHPLIDQDLCIGCGLCADACRKHAMRMVRGPERPYIPQDAMERGIRAAIERGRLAQLLFDEGAGRGEHFVGAAVRTILALPLAQRALAQEQVRSRFLRAALERARGSRRIPA